MVLIVSFSDGSIKYYDCSTVVARNDYYKRLENPGFFKNFQIDNGGHGIYWDDDVDLSEYEIYQNGKNY